MKDEMNLEDELNEALRYLGLRDWNVVWDPEPSEKAKGLIIPEDKIILISDEEPEAAYDTLAHEYLEIRLQAMVEARNATINALLKALQEIFYKEKERGIDSLIPFVLKMLKEREADDKEKKKATKNKDDEENDGEEDEEKGES